MLWMPFPLPTVRRKCSVRHCTPETAKIEGVSPLSTARKLGVVARLAGKQVRGSRTGGALWGAMRATGSSMTKVLRQLWLEVIGALFLAMAAMGGVSAVREFMEFRAGRAAMSHVAIAACFTVTFAWFGMSSFLRVRKGNSGRRG